MKIKKKLTYLFLLALAIRAVLAFQVYHPDLRNHMDWGLRFWDYGPGHFFEANVWNFTWPNQPPGTMYVFAGIYKLYKFIFSILWSINIKIPLFPSKIISVFSEDGYQALLKLPAILSDLGIALLIYKFIVNFSQKIKDKKKVGFLGALIFLVNPVVWYNSSVWGQYDSLINFLVLASFYMLYKKKLFVSMTFFALSIYTKVSLVIFAPIYAVLLFRKSENRTALIKSATMAILVIFAITYPFSNGSGKDPATWLFYLYKDKILGQQLEVITANAFNLWGALTGLYEQPHTLTLGPITYRAWGLLLFAFSYLPPVIMVYRKQDIKTLFWSLSIVAFSTFMLLTNMHERYLFPLFPVFTVVVVMQKSLFPIYWAISGISLINMFHLWWVPNIKSLMDFLDMRNRLMPRLLSFSNLIAYLFVYNKYFENIWKNTKLSKSSTK